MSGADVRPAAGPATLPTTADLIRRYAIASEEAANIVRTLSANDDVARMRAVVDAIWTHLHSAGVSWVGFYVPDPSEQTAEPQRLVLGPCRNTPACSPIGLHGVCGQALRSREIGLVHDVRALGEAYVACDPRDRAEVVIPLVRPVPGGERCLAVLDLDSHQVGRFSTVDIEGLKGVLVAAGIPDRAGPRG